MKTLDFPRLLQPTVMGLVERLSSLPLSYVLIIVAIVKFSLIVCLCGLDLCTSADPVPLQLNGSRQQFRRKEEKYVEEEEQA